MNNILTKIQLTIAVVAGVISSVYGEAANIIYALLAFMAVDYVTGLIKGFVNKELASNVGARGLAKKGMILFVILVATVLDIVALDSTGLVASATAIYYMCNEAISITENAVAIGVPLPQKLIDLLAQLRGDSNDSNTD